MRVHRLLGYSESSIEDPTAVHVSPHRHLRGLPYPDSTACRSRSQNVVRQAYNLEFRPFKDSPLENFTDTESDTARSRRNREAEKAMETDLSVDLTVLSLPEQPLYTGTSVSQCATASKFYLQTHHNISP